MNQESNLPMNAWNVNRHAATCPVCHGNGLVPKGFYSQTSGQWTTTSLMPETCRGCGGKGWVVV